MKAIVYAVGLGLLLGIGGARSMAAVTSPPGGTFNFPLVNPHHEYMQRLLANAMGYLKPENGLVDPASERHNRVLHGYCDAAISAFRPMSRRNCIPSKSMSEAARYATSIASR